MKLKSFDQKWLRPIALGLVAGGVLVGVIATVGITTRQTGQAEPTETIAEKTELVQSLVVTAYRSPTCGCCGGWSEHMQAQGFQVKDQVTEDLEAIKQRFNVPTKLTSCHTAVVGGYVIEGHVPAADIRRLLTEKPDVIGIAVPGMPLGSPGMEAGDLKEPYTVFSFNENGQIGVFNEYTF